MTTIEQVMHGLVHQHDRRKLCAACGAVTVWPGRCLPCGTYGETVEEPCPLCQPEDFCRLLALPNIGKDFDPGDS